MWLKRNEYGIVVIVNSKCWMFGVEKVKIKVVCVMCYVCLR